MAHFAELDDNNVVTQVIVVANEELIFEGVENETQGVIFCRSLFGNDTKWVQTSYNGNIRKHYAGIGYTYDEARDAFIAPKPNDFTDEEGNSFTFILNEETCQWETSSLG
jgi:hypothetical protein